MPPQTTVPSPNGKPHDPYDFIFKEPPKKRGILPSGNSTTQRILIVVGGGLLVIALFAIIFSIIFGGSGGGANLSAIAQEQSELIRISSNMARQTRNETTAGFVNNVQYSLISDQQATTAYLSKQGTKLNPKFLTQSQNPATDKLLAAAGLAGNYDSVAIENLKNQLIGYQTDLAAAFKKASSPSQKALINKMYIHVTALLKNVPQA